MEPVITSEVVVAYSQCPRKAYLLMFSSDKGEPHEYVQILEQERCENQARYIDRVKQKFDDVQPYTADNLREGHDVLVNANLQANGFEASCSALTKVEGKSALGKHSYEPTLCIGTHTVSREQKLEIAFVGHVLEQLQNKPPMAGRIIGMNGSSHGVKLDNCAKAHFPILKILQAWIANSSPEAPPIVLNKHCPYCPLRHACREKAEQEDNLSLLDRMTPKVMQRYHRKGIFTVHQLSYLFTPQRRRKGSKNQPVHFNLELQAFSIRTSKIYVHELPELTRHSIELFLDFEGIPDQCFQYLVGLLICEGEHQTHHALWADSVHDEERIWNELLTLIQRYPDAPIYHYGSYEPKAIAQLATRYETPADGLIARLVNVNTFIYGKLYFPVRSNTLKELGTFVGASWSRPDASGLQSLVWRHR